MGKHISALALALGLLAATGASALAQSAYVANQLDNTVSVIDIASNTVIQTIPVGVNPFGAAVSPDFKRAYVTNGYPGPGGNSVSVINTATNTVIATIPVGGSPTGVAVAPDSS